MKYYIILTLLLGIIPKGNASSQRTNLDARTPGKCIAYTNLEDRVVFTCENNIKATLQLLGEGIVRMNFEELNDTLIRNTSFALTENALAKSQKINVSEQVQSYEIFTSKLIIRINKDPFQIRFFDKYQKLLLEDYEDKGFTLEGENIASRKTLRANEEFFGLGEKSGSINRRGKSFKMWNSDRPCYGVNEDPLYKSIPFFMSSYGYGIFFDNTYKSEFKMGSDSEEYYSFEAPGGQMTYYFIYGPTYKQILKGYIQLTGNPIMPPCWALGFSQSRGMLTNEKLTREIASQFRERKIPCDIIYQDIGWTQHLQDFEWKEENYDEPVQMLADLDEKGFKVIVSQDPVVSQDNKKQWKEADSLGYFTTDVRTGKSYDMPWPWGGNCGIVDFTKPEVANWWGNYQQKVIDDGVRGFWTDMGEPAWSNEEDTDRLFMQHYLGMHDEIHNVYGLTWDKVVTEEFEKRNPNTRIFQMTRAAYAGMQKYTFGWSGDSGNGNDVLSGWANLKQQIPVALSAGMGLIPFWTSDISGYCGDISDKEEMGELYARWMQFGIFNPLSRAHHEGNNAVEPWEFGPEVEQICKKAIELKYQLFPYIYTYAREAYETGLPIMRAVVLEYPDDKETYHLNNQFLFGKDIMVAPVVEKGASQVKIYLPEGEWIDFSNGTRLYQGKTWIEYPVEIETIPIFVKKGSIIPTMPVMQYIGEDPNYPLLLDVYPAAKNRKALLNVYEDDGISNDYKQDVYAERILECKTTEDAFEISHEIKNHNEFHWVKRNVLIRLHCQQKPKKLLLDTHKVKRFRLNKTGQIDFDKQDKAVWAWDEQKKQCLVMIPNTMEFSKLHVEK
ncbi:glycoside hydrolase family 31 protein [Labilibaculum antarcticum]|uniref:Glycosyl hydrolase family 31 n=1 Tax=Labilibaculum antarcticum TaxID=1717717 RepID=A0A1Y1CR34_9BACT|nr:glycoside hydrolase family 31 protein [Labilibaculum antarcticum]BAX82402.1 glycosyl hydrolase family 31 [Labilibaculum antarcticum]